MKTLRQEAADPRSVEQTRQRRQPGLVSLCSKRCGAGNDAIKSWGGQVTCLPSKEQGELMRDRRADAILNSLFVGHGSIKRPASAIPLSLLPIGDGTADKVAGDWKISKFTIPNAAYDWTAGDVGTVTLAAQLFVNESADDKMVADVTSAALIAHADKVAGVHKAMKKLDAKLMGSGTAIAYHPAAEKAYKAAGLR